MSIEYLRGYREIRKDPELFGKLMVATLLILSGMIIPIIGQAVLLGWYALALRRELHGVGTPLPPLPFDFDYLGKLLGIGFKALIVSFVWTLPAVALMMTVGTCLYVGLALAMGGVGASLEDGGGTGSAVGTTLFLVVMLLGYVLMFALFVISMLPATIAVMRTEIADDIGQGMKFGEVMRATRLVLKELVFGGIANAFVAMLLVFAGMLLLCIGMYPATAAVSAARAYFLADIYRLAVERGMEPLQVAPPEVPPKVVYPPAAYGPPGAYGPPPGYRPPPGGGAPPPSDPNGWPPTGDRG